MHNIWPGRRAHWVKYKNINNSDLDGMSLASFCQSRAAVLGNMFTHEWSAQIPLFSNSIVPPTKHN